MFLPLDPLPGLMPPALFHIFCCHIAYQTECCLGLCTAESMIPDWSMQTPPPDILSKSHHPASAFLQGWRLIRSSSRIQLFPPLQWTDPILNTWISSLLLTIFKALKAINYIKQGWKFTFDWRYCFLNKIMNFVANSTLNLSILIKRLWKRREIIKKFVWSVYLFNL